MTAAQSEMLLVFLLGGPVLYPSFIFWFCQWEAFLGGLAATVCSGRQSFSFSQWKQSNNVIGCCCQSPSLQIWTNEKDLRWIINMSQYFKMKGIVGQGGMACLLLQHFWVKGPVGQRGAVCVDVTILPGEKDYGARRGGSQWRYSTSGRKGLWVIGGEGYDIIVLQVKGGWADGDITKGGGATA